jgi:hypothetical protein
MSDQLTNPALRYIVEHLPRDIAERKKMLRAILEMVPEKDPQHALIGHLLKTLLIHEEKQIELTFGQ